MAAGENHTNTKSVAVRCVHEYQFTRVDIHILDKTIKRIDGRVFHSVSSTIMLAIIVVVVVVIQMRFDVCEVFDEHTLCFVANLIVGDTNENV
jgi:hypothetical protein